VGHAGGDVLREEELELLVRKLAQLRAEHIVDADVVCIASAGAASVSAPGVSVKDAVRRCCGFGGIRCNTHAR
jgi:hypothetical protein